VNGNCNGAFSKPPGLKPLIQVFHEAMSPVADTIIVSPTFYLSLDDTRCRLGLEACQRAAEAGVRVLLVDASPPDVHAALIATGATVLLQTVKGRKGAALREAIAAAVEMLPADGIICYQELEKVSMVALQLNVADALRAAPAAGVCVARRDDALFRSSYPVEQYHSEHFANLYLDALAKAVSFPSIDWTFGPLAFRAALARHWLECSGELWDAQIVPMVVAARWHGWGVIVHPVSFRTSLVMPPASSPFPPCVRTRRTSLFCVHPSFLTTPCIGLSRGFPV